MIYIEVIFGAINGNALDVDSALSLTSTNPVQNKVIAAELDILQQNIDAVAGSHAFTIDFQTDLTVVHDVVTSAITIKSIKVFNISSLKYQIGNDNEITLTPDENGNIANLSIDIPEGSRVDWEIVRIDGDAPAAAGIVYKS